MFVKVLLLEKSFRPSDITQILTNLFSVLDDNTTEVYLFSSPDSQSFIPEAILQKLSGIQLFDNYYSSQMIEYEAIKLHKTFPYQQIIAFREFDMLRAARVRELLDLPGQRVRETELFRDKYLMKREAQRCGLKVPLFAKVDTVTELMSFLTTVNYPIVIKPRKMAGSIGFYILKNPQDLEQFLLETSTTADIDAPLDMIAEEYVGTKLVHVDGLCHQGKIIAITPSEYMGLNAFDDFSTENYQTEKYLGSLTLEKESVLGQELVGYTTTLLQAFDSINTYPFHVELWLDEKTNAVMLNEAAARMGGLRVLNLLNSLYQPTIEQRIFHFFCTGDESLCAQPLIPAKSHCYSGMVPVTPGEIISVPEHLPETNPAFYRCLVKPGECISIPTNHTDYIKFIFGNIVTLGESREECLQLFDAALQEFKEKAVIKVL